MTKNILISLMLGMVISGVAIYYAFRNVPFSDLTMYLASVNYLWIFPAVLIVLISFMLRVLRWQVILSSSRKITFWDAFHPLMIGFMINCILPGRVGEVARPVILQQRDTVPFSTGLATVAAERTFDLIILVALFTGVFSWVQIDTGLNISFGGHHLSKATLDAILGGMLRLMLLLIIGIAGVSFHTSRRLINRCIMGGPSLLFFARDDTKTRLREKVCTPLVCMVENFASGFALMRSPKKIAICMGFSALVWSFQAFSYYMVSLGCPDIGLSYAEITAVMLLICFFIMLPSVPGYWGLWEAGGIFALSIFGVLSKDAAGYTLLNHAVQVFPVILVGLVSAMLIGINIWRISYAAD